jgi:ketosteroid isomerase-like protein
MVPGYEPGSGPKAVEKLIAGDIALGGKLTLRTEDVVDGKQLDHGPYLTLYRKAGGSWRIYRDIWNSSMPSK